MGEKKYNLKVCDKKMGMTALESCLPEKIQKGENGHNEISWSTSIEEKIDQLNSQIVRTENSEKLENIFFDLFKKIFSGNNIEQKYLIVALLVNTRDINLGKGEYNLYYRLLSKLKILENDDKLFNLIKEIIQRSVLKKDNIEPYGSWKDVKYILNVMRESYGELELINSRIFKFIMVMIKERIEKDKEELGRGGEISLLAKWLPREKSKKFGWQSKYISLEVGSESDPFSNGGKKNNLCNYRKLIAKLNRELGTIQINQCEKNWKNINFDKKVTSITLAKQKYAFEYVNKYGIIRGHDPDRLICKDNYEKYIKECINGEKEIKSRNVDIISMIKDTMVYNDIKKWSRGIENGKEGSECLENILNQINLQWKENGKKIKKLDNF